MQDFCKKDYKLSSAHSTAACVAECASRWTSSASQIRQSALSKNLSLKMSTANQVGHNTKQMGFQFQDQDSSSSQSTCQSYHEVASVGESDPYEQSTVSLQSGFRGTHGKPGVGQNKSALFVGTQDFVLPPTEVNCRQSYSCAPLSYTDPYYSGLLAAYGPQAMIYHPQMLLGMQPGRVPLPLDLPHDEPIYVNPKQYRAILRRRQYRAKLEAQNKLAKARKPYLHESRHLHALKRARGSGGRFLNTKKSQEFNSTSTAKGHDISGSTQLHLTANVSETDIHRPENYKECASTTSCSDITSASNSENFFQQQEFRFSAYPPCISKAYAKRWEPTLSLIPPVRDEAGRN